MKKEEINKRIEVYAHWQGFPEPVIVGTLFSSLTRGKEVFSFEFDKSWLDGKHAEKLQIDKRLQLVTGIQHQYGENNFGFFLDSSPDRWGRDLMEKRESIKSRQEGRRERPLFDSDFLLGVMDTTRMGALRYKYKGEFVYNDVFLTTPSITSINEIERVCREYESGRIDIANKFLYYLIGYGSSLGGARPKAIIKDDKGTEYIAKFPSKNDRYDSGGWEMVARQLAIRCGINVCDAFIKKVSSDYHTYFSKRFDRAENGERIHFASAMALLGYKDGESKKSSYLEIVEFITKNGCKINENLEQLFRRVAFNIAIKNTDDHLRNHGFILSSSGWELSPVYDVNPISYGMELSMNITLSDNSLNYDLLTETADFYRLSKEKAQAIIEEIKLQAGRWETIASGIGLSNEERSRMKPAFEYIGQEKTPDPDKRQNSIGL